MKSFNVIDEHMAKKRKPAKAKGLTGRILPRDIIALITGQRNNNEKIFMEEPAELIQAISKYSREPSTQHRDNLIEEMADTLIILECLCDFYSIKPDEVYKQLEAKMRRNLLRVEAKHD